jgi:glycosyltransferase involved in cell wall biosynthesis
MNKSLLLFTLSFPYTAGNEHTFIFEELKHLKANFDRVILIPTNCIGQKINIGTDIEIDESYCKFLVRKRSKFNRFFNGIGRLFLVELTQNPKLLTRPKEIYKLLSFIDSMKEARKWFNKSSYKLTDCTFYTYWFTYITSSFSLSSKEAVVVTRVHGIDLYLERNDGYIPLRKETLKYIKYVLCVSEAGKKYLNLHYPEYENKIKVSRLGVVRNSDNIKNTKPIPNHWVIVSCSSVIELKRVKLIMESVIIFSKQNPNYTIEYTHFGDGSLMNELELLKNQTKVNNLIINLQGDVENSYVISFYQLNFVDIFINASTTEGVPLSLQEAQSYGIPVICTAVGGNPEVVNGFNGYLVGSNPTSAEIAEVMNRFSKLSIEETAKYRINSYENWYNNFNADKNFSEFAYFISKI